MTLFKEAIRNHLTEAPADRQARASHPGMAHFAGTGPEGRTCRECASWEHDKHGYRSKNGKHRGLIEPGRCKKFVQLMMRAGDKIPDDAAACRHFEENQAPPERFKKG